MLEVYINGLINDNPTNIAAEENTILSFNLKQNYPNPFNPETTISYTIDKPGKVSLVVYNILGQTVEKLVDEFQDKGIYSIKWNPAIQEKLQLNSGIYFAQLNNSERSKIIKMIYLKKIKNIYEFIYLYYFSFSEFQILPIIKKN